MVPDSEGSNDAQRPSAEGTRASERRYYPKSRASLLLVSEKSNSGAGHEKIHNAL